MEELQTHLAIAAISFVVFNFIGVYMTKYVNMRLAHIYFFSAIAACVYPLAWCAAIIFFTYEFGQYCIKVLDKLDS